MRNRRTVINGLLLLIAVVCMLTGSYNADIGKRIVFLVGCVAMASAIAMSLYSLLNRFGNSSKKASPPVVQKKAKMPSYNISAELSPDGAVPTNALDVIVRITSNREGWIRVSPWRLGDKQSIPPNRVFAVKVGNTNIQIRAVYPKTEEGLVARIHLFENEDDAWQAPLVMAKASRLVVLQHSHHSLEEFPEGGIMRDDNDVHSSVRPPAEVP